MFINLSYLRYPACRLPVHQLGRSCVRWLCIAPFSSLDVKKTAFQLTFRADVGVAQEGVIKSKGKEPQRSLTKPALRRYALIKSALLRYKEMHGNMLVPFRFIVPRDDESWPSETWGMKLGQTVSNIRSDNTNKDQKEELASIGFDYSPQAVRYGYDVVKSALLRYKEMHGDMLVPARIIIPRDDGSWPSETWGMKLGQTVSNIRCGHSYKDKQEKLRIIDNRLRLQFPKYCSRL